MPDKFLFLILNATSTVDHQTSFIPSVCISYHQKVKAMKHNVFDKAVNTS